MFQFEKLAIFALFCFALFLVVVANASVFHNKANCSQYQLIAQNILVPNLNWLILL